MAGFVLHGLIYGLERTHRVLPLVWTRTLAGLGVLLYAGVGVACILMGGSYLDYGALRPEPHNAQHVGIMLVELGVLATVFGGMLTIFYVFAGRGRTREWDA